MIKPPWDVLAAVSGSLLVVGVDMTVLNRGVSQQMAIPPAKVTAFTRAEPTKLGQPLCFKRRSR